MNRKYYPASELLNRRGWTEAGIRELLGQPDRLAPNPHNSRASRMRLYRTSRVAEAEAGADFAKKNAARARKTPGYQRREHVGEAFGLAAEWENCAVEWLTRDPTGQETGYTARVVWFGGPDVFIHLPGVGNPIRRKTKNVNIYRGDGVKLFFDGPLRNAKWPSHTT